MWGCLDRYAVWVYATVMYLYIYASFVSGYVICLLLAAGWAGAAYVSYMCKFEDTDFDDLWLETKAKRTKAKASSAKRKHVLRLGRGGWSGLK
ncbi:hypothetical protein L1987_87043 [Smallanthus sonchifolius]|nr:hypothetical protein L1987_87043 [Smallanthus sonchifolius]